EHYWGYAAQRDGDCVEYQVEHPRWRGGQTSEAAFECDVKRGYGRQFVECLSAKPGSAVVADGSAIVVREGMRICGSRGGVSIWSSTATAASARGRPESRGGLIAIIISSSSRIRCSTKAS